jgi:hypothetical protein
MREGLKRRTISVGEALLAQKALREAAGLEPEVFPIESFVALISNEIDVLRKIGKSDAEIARMIEAYSNIRISGSEISEYYVALECRRKM